MKLKYSLMLGIIFVSVWVQAVNIDHAKLVFPSDKKELLEALAKQKIYVEQQGEFIQIWVPQSLLFHKDSTRLTTIGEKTLAELNSLMRKMTIPNLTITGYYDEYNSSSWDLKALVRSQIEELNDYFWQQRAMGSMLLMGTEDVRRDGRLSFWQHTHDHVFFALTFKQDANVS